MIHTIDNILESYNDPKDYLSVVRFRPEDIPDEIENEVPIIFDQGVQGSCVANGRALSLISLANRARMTDINPSRQFIHNSTKVFSNRVGLEGVYPRNSFAATFNYGFPSDSEYPYGPQFNNLIPEDNVFEKALKTRASRYERVVPIMSSNMPKQEKIHRINSVLAEGYLVGFGMSVTNSIYTDLEGPLENHNYKTINKDNLPVGGHWMTLYGKSKRLGGYLGANSWGTGKHYNGRFLMPFDIVSEWGFEAWVDKEINGIGAISNPGIFKENLSSYHLTCRIIPEPQYRNKTVNIWVAVFPPEIEMLKGAKPYIKTGNRDTYIEYDGTNLVPCFTDYFLGDYNPISVVNFAPMKNYVGCRIFIGYGKDIETAIIKEVMTIPPWV